MKRKIGIITITEGNNYGNKLQNYALLSYLKFMNKKYEVETLKNNVSTMSLIVRIKIFIKRLVPTKKNFRYLVRDIKTRKFNRKYLKFGDKVKKKRKARYDVIVCGSDQIWNPYFFKDVFPMMGGTVKCDYIISYAASFGVSSIPDERILNYKRSIFNIKKISVREKSGVELINKISSRESVCVIDPVLLLTKEKWQEIEKKPKRCPDKYILTYFLGQTSDKTKDFINELASLKGLEIVKLNDKNNCYFTICPREFLYLIHNAEYVLTDSFHATVFSIIFEKKFSVYHREDIIDMFSRIETLLNTLMVNGKTDIYDTNLLNSTTNWEKIKKIIEEEKEKATCFLNSIYE